MTAYLAIAVLALAALVVGLCFRALAKERREHARERQAWTAERGVLLDRIMHLAGSTWTLPDVAVPALPAEPETVVDVDDELVANF